MSKSTISTFQLFALIPDAETARLYDLLYRALRACGMEERNP